MRLSFALPHKRIRLKQQGGSKILREFFLRWFHTLRFLKWSQIAGRPIAWAKRKFFHLAKVEAGARRAGIIRSGLPGSERELCFSFQNLERRFRSGKVRWNPEDEARASTETRESPRMAGSSGAEGAQGNQRVPGTEPDRLWWYSLNYFDFLEQTGFLETPEEGLHLILEWIAGNPRDSSLGWEPYVVSRRVVNWSNWLTRESGSVIPPDCRELIHSSMGLQLRRLALDLEYHVQANHLFENFKALFIGGSYLFCAGSRFSAAIRHIRAGLEGLRTEIGEQVLADGGHYERSPMYHRDVLASLRQIRAWTERTGGLGNALSGVPEQGISGLGTLCSEKILLMQDWLSWMRHPDGEIALFHDSGIDPDAQAGPGKTVREPFVEGVRLLSPSGYFVKRWNDGNTFLLDCGVPSPSFQPGHSHCSVGSFELSIRGRRTIVDTGCGSYHHPMVRRRCRETAAHNVPMIEGCEQSEIWGSFRMGRRASVETARYDRTEGVFAIEFTDFHGNSYARRIRFLPAGIEVIDRVLKRTRQGTLRSILHFHPSVRPSENPGTQGNGYHDFQAGGSGFVVCTTQASELSNGSYHPGFGREEAAIIMVIKEDSTDMIKYAIRF